MFIKMNGARDYSTWLQVAKCFKIWDLDPRGYHKSLWRFFMKGNQLLVVGVPHSPYSSFKPSHVTPIYLEDRKIDLNRLKWLSFLLDICYFNCLLRETYQLLRDLWPVLDLWFTSMSASDEESRAKYPPQHQKSCHFDL